MDTKAAEASDPAGPEPYVRVNVTDLVGLKDGGLAGVLYATDGERLTEDLAVGGFGVAVDADPFTTSQVVSAPSSVEATGALFPDVTGVPLAVERGPYTLVLWAGVWQVDPRGRRRHGPSEDLSDPFPYYRARWRHSDGRGHARRYGVDR